MCLERAVCDQEVWDKGEKKRQMLKNYTKTEIRAV